MGRFMLFFFVIQAFYTYMFFTSKLWSRQSFDKYHVCWEFRIFFLVFFKIFLSFLQRWVSLTALQVVLKMTWRMSFNLFSSTPRQFVSSFLRFVSSLPRQWKLLSSAKDYQRSHLCGTISESGDFERLPARARGSNWGNCSVQKWPSGGDDLAFS